MDMPTPSAPDRRATLAAIERATAATDAGAPVSLRREGGEVVVEIGAGRGAGTVFLVGYDPEHSTSVGRGENGGRTLVEANIVRAFDSVAAWSGAPISVRRTLPAGERLAVIVQAADGRIIGAAREPTHAS